MAKRRSRYWWVDLGWYGAMRDGVVTLWHKGWRGIPDKCTAFQQGGRTGAELLRAVEEEITLLLDKGVGRRVAGGATATVADPDFASAHPVLFSYLTQRAWPDGSARQTSSLTVFEDSGTMKAVLKDREAGLTLWAASPTIMGLLGVLEALLCDPQAEWREERSGPGGKASRVKR